MLFPESPHVTLVELSGETPDQTTWEFVKAERFTLVTANADFVQLPKTHGVQRILQPFRLKFTEKQGCRAGGSSS